MWGLVSQPSARRVSKRIFCCTATMIPTTFFSHNGGARSKDAMGPAVPVCRVLSLGDPVGVEQHLLAC